MSRPAFSSAGVGDSIYFDAEDESQFESASLLSEIALNDGPVRRLRIDGKKLIDPDTNEEIRLTGFNWTLKYTYKNEGQIMREVLPGANVARIVGIFWKNANDGKDCYQSQAPYFKDSCFKELD